MLAGLVSCPSNWTTDSDPNPGPRFSTLHPLPPIQRSTAGIELDLGSLAISNTLAWHSAPGSVGKGLDVGGWVVLDHMQVRCSSTPKP